MTSKETAKAQIVTLHLQGLKPKEIASKLNVTVGSVKMCISRLKRQSGYTEIKQNPKKLKESIKNDFKDALSELQLPEVTKDFLAKKQNNIGFLTLCMTERVVDYLNSLDVIKDRDERETMALKIKAIQLVNTMFAKNNNN